MFSVRINGKYNYYKKIKIIIGKFALGEYNWEMPEIERRQNEEITFRVQVKLLTLSTTVKRQSCKLAELQSGLRY